jgi:hypothetical protein
MTTETEQMERLPVLTIVIQHDPRGGRTTVNVIDSQGNPVAFSTAHQLLDAGRSALIQQEVAPPDVDDVEQWAGQHPGHERQQQAGEVGHEVVEVGHIFTSASLNREAGGT